MDVSALRTQIKSWERQYKQRNGRDPTIQDIKNTPGMPEKYRLYKKLLRKSDSASSSSASRPISSDRPSTPPKSQPRQPKSSALSKRRVIKGESQPDVLTSNPFSPVRNKGKERALAIASLSISTPSGSNPFTPRKPKTQPREPRRSPSPDPFPLNQPSQSPSPISPSAAQRPPNPSTQSLYDGPYAVRNTPVTRARKRLRGEPVSPSPVKEKRARVSSRASLPAARHSTLMDISEEEEDASHPSGEAAVDDEEAFFTNSPVKQRSGKFTLLFEEEVVQQDVRTRPLRKAPSRRATLATLPLPVFGSEPKKGRGTPRAFSPEDDEMDWDAPVAPGGKIKALDLSLGMKPEKKKTVKKGVPRAVLPGKDDLWAAAPPSNGAHATKAPHANGLKSGPSKEASRTAAKRSLSEDEMDVDEPPHQPLPPSGPLLIPPSPPPADAESSRYGYKGNAKGKGLPAGGRKKAKLLEEMVGKDGSDGESLEDEDMRVKERTWTWNPNSVTQAEDIPQDEEPGADYEAPEFDPTTFRTAPLVIPDSPESGEFNVDVPDELKGVLALSPHKAHTFDIDEDRIARELVYGRREGHYDAIRGGEIWDVGEVDDEDDEERAKKVADDDTDDWEGEPIPWELGEL